MNQEFFPVEGYPDTLISREGIIISRYGKVLKHMKCHSTGYLRVRIRGKRKNIHRLLALNFIPNPNNYPMVNHIDGNKHNNNLINLEWCTIYQNNKHAKDNGLLVRGTEVHTNVLDEIQVVTIMQCLIDGVGIMMLSNYFKVHSGTIERIKYGKSWKHMTDEYIQVKGYRISYL